MTTNTKERGGEMKPAISRRPNVKTAPTTTRDASHNGILSSLDLEQRKLYEEIPAVVDCVYHPTFAQPSTEEKLFGESAEQIEVPNWTHFPEVAEDIPVTRARRTVLGAKDEVKLFLRYNYARYRLGKLVEAQQRRVSLNRAMQMILWYRRVMHARASLVRANMALVLSMAKRTRIPNVEFSELVSEGNMALLRSVEKFDVARGFKFSTYACRAILKSFNRLATKTGRYRQHFPTEFDPDLERSDFDIRKHDIQWDDSLDALRDILAHNRARLSEVERTVVMERFAITSRAKGRTLAEVGKLVGLTNERVRQIQNMALNKIRMALDDEYLVA
jgi:RNA polymerase sigma factor (sigma-70 family)